MNDVNVLPDTSLANEDCNKSKMACDNYMRGAKTSALETGDFEDKKGSAQFSKSLIQPTNKPYHFSRSLVQHATNSFPGILEFMNDSKTSTRSSDDLAQPLFTENTSKQTMTSPTTRFLATLHSFPTPRLSLSSGATDTPTGPSDPSTWGALLDHLKSLSSQDRARPAQDDVMNGIIRGVEELVEMLYLPSDHRVKEIKPNTSDKGVSVMSKPSEVDSDHSGLRTEYTSTGLVIRASDVHHSRFYTGPDGGEAREKTSASSHTETITLQVSSYFYYLILATGYIIDLRSRSQKGNLIIMPLCPYRKLIGWFIRRRNPYTLVQLKSTPTHLAVKQGGQQSPLDGNVSPPF